MSDLTGPLVAAEQLAADRLEEALERIAILAHNARADGATTPGIQELRSRLDQLIAQLRTTLAAINTAGG